MNDFSPPDLIAQWASEYCLSELSPEDATQLSSALRQDAGLRTWFLDYMHVHAQLHWEHRVHLEHGAQHVAAAEGSSAAPSWPEANVPGPDVSTQPPAAAPPTHSLARVLNFPQGLTSVLGGWLSNPKLLALTVVTSLAVYFVGLVVSIAIERAQERRASRESGVAAAGAPARVVADAGCRWQQRSSTPPGDFLAAARRSSLVAGVVELEFSGGARVRIEGPAEFTALSGGRLELDHGRLLAYVPKPARGFIVSTPTAELIDLGTEFGVEVDRQGDTDLHVLRGKVEIKPAAKSVARPGAASTRVGAGEAVRVSADRPGAARIAYQGSRFAITPASADTNRSPREGEFSAQQPIWLGNLFDDRPHTPLAAAVKTDTYRAEADGEDLGVARVGYGGAAVAEIAPGIRFDLSSLGWEAASAARIANDATGILNEAPLRLAGHNDPLPATKVEEGIGMHANTYLTFSLSEIRAAGKLGNRPLEFLCDRCGVDDDVIGNPNGGGSVHMAVLLSSRTDVQEAWVDGARASIDRQEDRWRLNTEPGEPLTSAGQTFAVRVLLPADIQYVTLICSSAGDGIHADHGAWLGARLELRPRGTGQGETK